MAARHPIIHCDECYFICMGWEMFCSHCRRRRSDFTWEAVQFGPDASKAEQAEYERRDLLRGRQPNGFMLLHCDQCYGLLNMAVENYCRVCGYPVEAISWPVEEFGTMEYKRRERLADLMWQHQERIDYPA